MTENLDVKLLTQNFSEAGGLEVFSDLEPVKPVCVKLGGKYKKTSSGIDYESRIDKLNKLLIEYSQKDNINFIFKIRYFNNENDDPIEAIGDGYRRRKNESI